jgi:hypothetical protein
MSKRLREELQQAGELDPHAPLSRRDAAAYLRRKYLVGSQSFLAKAAVIGGGPIHQRFGTRTIYRAADLRRVGQYPSERAAHRS